MNRPRPVLTAAGIAGGITSITGVLAFLGYADAATNLTAQTQTIVSVTIGAVTLGSHVLAALHAQAKVTPTADPAGDDGTPLVPVSTTPLIHYTTSAPSTFVAEPRLPATGSWAGSGPTQSSAAALAAADEISPMPPPKHAAAPGPDEPIVSG